jgi:EF-hand domain pair
MSQNLVNGGDGNLGSRRLYHHKAAADCGPDDQGHNMSTKKSMALLALSAILIGSLSTTAIAKGMGDHGPMRMLNFKEIDADKDGKVTAEEFAAFRAAEFAKADTNSDGQISAEELAARHIAEATGRAAEMSAQMIERMDEDGNGQLSMEEMENGPRPVSMFERADEDGDGALTQAEVDATMQKMRGKHGRHGQDNN